MEEHETIDGYFLIKPEDLQWRPSNMMKRLIVGAPEEMEFLPGARTKPDCH